MLDRYRKVSLEDEYNRNPDLKKEDVIVIQEWIRDQHGFPKISDLEITLFLHSNFYDIEATKTTIKPYFECRTDYGEFFKNFDLNSDPLVQACDAITLASLPQRTLEGYKVIYGRLHNFDPSVFNLAECVKLFTMLVDVIHLKEGTLPGIVLAFDMDGAQMGHLFKLSIFVIKHYLYYLQEAMPVRIKSIHFFNIVPFVDKILALVRPFMKQSLYDILVLHPKIDTVYEYVPAENFPKDYDNGKAPSLSEFHEIYYKELLEFQEYFYEEEKTRRLPKESRKSLFRWF